MTNELNLQDEKVVICFSGGYDSFALLEYLKNEGFQPENIHLLYFMAKQKNQRKEEEALKKLRNDTFGLHFRYIDVDTHHMKNHGENLYYPMRNLVYLAQAVSYAESIGAKFVAIGFVGVGDYPDTTEQFATLFNALTAMTVGINLLTPFSALTKLDVADHVLYPIGGEELVLKVLDMSFSCNVPEEMPMRECGKCPDCLERKEIYENYSTPIAEEETHTV